MGMWWIYIVDVIFVYLMIKNIVVYKNQRKIIYAIHKYNRRFLMTSTHMDTQIVVFLMMRYGRGGYAYLIRYVGHAEK